MSFNKMITKKLKSLLFLLGVLYFYFSAASYSFAAPKDYDGIWFLGFNLKNAVFSDPKVRQAVNLAINRENLALKIVSSEAVPIGFVPPGMLGYNPDLEPTFYDRREAKKIMTRSGHPMNDKRIKNLTLLHTDGLLTVEIAREIQKDLKAIGMKIDLVEVSYKNEDNWINELTSGKHALFLMGYKADIEKIFSEEATSQDDSYSLLEPLFKTEGDANFTGYSNKEVDKLLDQVSGLNLALKNDRHAKLKEINQILYNDLPVIVLFYIEKL
jgi:peptide/nickel transport system substrate-binding protein